MTTPMGARKKLTRRVETAGSVVAGGAGAAFGAAKLRDTHVAQYGKTHVHAGAKALTHVVPPRTAVKLATRNPGFKTLAIGSAAGAVAAAADHYGDHLNHKQRRMAAQAKKEPTVSKSAFLDEPISKALSDRQKTAAAGVASGTATLGGLHLGNKADATQNAANRVHTAHEAANAHERATKLFPIQHPSAEAAKLGRKAVKLRRGSTAALTAGAVGSVATIVHDNRAKKLVAKRDEKVSAFGVRHP